MIWDEYLIFSADMHNSTHCSIPSNSTRYLSSKAIGFQWVCLVFSSETVDPYELKFWGMISLGVQMLKNYFRIRPTVRRKIEKTLTILATILHITSSFSYLIPLPPEILTTPWCSGYGIMIQVARIEVQTPVIDTTENHYSFVVAV